MVSHTTKTITLDAFQWLPGTTNLATLAPWTKLLALHTPGDGTLHVPTGRGVFRANATDWVIQGPSMFVYIMPNQDFTTFFS